MLLLLFSSSFMSDSLWPYEWQHARPPCTLLSKFTQFMSIESVMLANHLILCHPLLLLPSNFPSIRVSSNESALLIRWPECWSFNFSISPSSEYLGWISFRVDWFDLLTVQGTLKSFFQHHSLKASILQCSAFFMVLLIVPGTIFFFKPHFIYLFNDLFTSIFLWDDNF